MNIIDVVIRDFFTSTTLICYILGVVVFLIASLDEVDRWEKIRAERPSVLLIIQIIGLTFIAITISILLCDVFSSNVFLTIFFSIISGLFGGHFIRFFDNNKNKIFDKAIGQIVSKFINRIFSIFKKTDTYTGDSGDYDDSYSSPIEYDSINSSDIMNICNKTKNSDNFIDDNKLDNYEHIKDKQEYNTENTIVDNEQTDYNPFENNKE